MLENIPAQIAVSGRKGGAWETRARLLIVLGAVYLAGFGAFAYMARGSGDLPGELTATLWVQSWRTPWLDTVMRAISAPGFQELALPLVGLVIAACFIKGWRRECCLLLAALLVTTVVITLISSAVARPRPSSDLVQTLRDLGGFSFPSGHVTHYAVFLGMLTFIVTQNMRPGVTQRLVQASFVLAMIAVGVSRIYLGAHWLGDVVAGYAVGAAVVAAFIGSWRLWQRHLDDQDPKSANY